jgi:cbb3-type cytochrome oxidase subunit 3
MYVTIYRRDRKKEKEIAAQAEITKNQEAQVEEKAPVRKGRPKRRKART